MNKFLTKIAGVVASLAMVIGVGVGVASKQAKGAYADPNTYTIGWGTATGSSGTYTNFSATSGTVDDLLSFTTAKNGGTTAPAYNSNNNDLRLYYSSNGNGGSITITPAQGITFTGFVLTATTSPSVKYSVDGGTATSVSASNQNVYTVSGISVSSSLTIQNVNTSNTQLRIKTISLSYTAPTKTLSSIALSGTYPTTFYQGDAFSHEGMIVTATYDDDSHKDVTSDATFTGYNMLETGEQTVTVSYAENEVTKTATYDITVSEQRVFTFNAANDFGDSPLTKGIITFTCNNGVLNNKSEYRLYKNSVTTFTSSGAHIGQIDFTGVSGNPASGFGSQTGWTTNGNNGTWKGDAASVTFTASGAQVRATSIVVTLVFTEPSVTVDPSEITLKTYNSNGITITATTQNIDTPTFDWNKNNNNITLTATENANEIVVKPNTDVDATAKVFLDVGGANPSLERVEINVTLEAPINGEIPEMAYTVAQARAAIDAGTNVNDVYATGIVSAIVIPLDNGVITYDISDDGLTTSEQLRAYRGKSFDGDNFTGEYDIEVGATVIIFGDLIKYNDSVYEFAYGNELVEYTAPVKTLTSIALSGTYPTNFYVGDEFSSEGIVVMASYDNGSSRNVAAQAAFSGYNMSEAGVQTVTVSYTEGLVTKTATYSITVVLRVIANYNLYEGSALAEGDYVIYDGGYALKAEISDKNRANNVEITPENDVIETDNETIVWHIARDGDYYTLFNVSVNKYLASTGSKNTAKLESDITDNSRWTLETDEGKFEFDRIFGQTIGHKYGAMNIEMKDGRILRVGLEGSFNSGEDEENPNRLIFDLVYCEYYDDDCNMMGINTDDIKAIYFCDEKIYG